MPARFRTLLLVLLLTSAIGACGQKGPLVAPPGAQENNRPPGALENDRPTGALENTPSDVPDAPEDDKPADTASPEDDNTPIDETDDR